MPLTDDDVREILRIIDESELDELSIETDGFSLHVTQRRRGGGGCALWEWSPRTPPRACSSAGRATTNAPD